MSGEEDMAPYELYLKRLNAVGRSVEVKKKREAPTSQESNPNVGSYLKTVCVHVRQLPTMKRR
jgi:hypothetical protein